MLKLGIEDIKIDFLRSVYESITKQIQQMDLKISILLSWNGAMAVILAKQVTDMIHQKMYVWYVLLLMAGVLAGMIAGAVYSYTVLKPRKSAGPAEGFAGLLYSGDILDLGKDSVERIQNYSNELLNIQDHEGVYRQFIKSVVLISSIQMKKSALFTKGLTATVTAFTLLLGLMTAMSLTGG